MITYRKPDAKIAGVAVSGGVDSMALFDFMRRYDENLILFHFHHGTPHADDAQNFIQQFAIERKIQIVLGSYQGNRGTEHDWRNARYAWLWKMTELHGGLIATAHHLDDCMESYLHGIMRTGHPRRIQYRLESVVRPILETRHSNLVQWAKSKCVPYIDDPTNMDTKYVRNRIRHNVMPEVLRINPGFHRVVRRFIRGE